MARCESGSWAGFGGFRRRLALAGVAAACLALAGCQFRAGEANSAEAPGLRSMDGCPDRRAEGCAEADFRAALRQRPGDARAAGLLAMTLSEDGRHKEALRYFKVAAAAGVSAYDFDAAWARSLAATGHLDQAIRRNYAALRLAPAAEKVRAVLADELARRGRAREAVDLLQTYDRTLEQHGEAPRFTAQIDGIARRTGVIPSQPPASEIADRGDDGSDAAPALAAADSNARDVPLRARGGALETTAIVDEIVPVSFEVDSGSSSVSLPQEVVSDLMRRGKITPLDYRGNGYAILANGERVSTQVFNLRTLKVGGHVLHNVTATSAPRGSPALLGQSFLGRFRTWSIDNRRKVLILQD